MLHLTQLKYPASFIRAFSKPSFELTVFFAVLSVLLVSFPTLSRLRLYSHDTIHHFLTHSWFLEAMRAGEFPFWYTAPIASFPTSTLQLGQWFHSPYIYALSLFDNYNYSYQDIRFEFLFWRLIAFIGFNLFASHHLNSSVVRVVAASMYISSGIVAASDPEILFIQSFAILPWVLYSLNMFFINTVRAIGLCAISVSSIIWFGYHGIALVLPIFALPVILLILIRSSSFQIIAHHCVSFCLCGFLIVFLTSLKISDTLTVPLFGGSLGPSRSSLDGLMLPSQLLSILFPNPTVFYGYQEPVSLQSLFVGVIPALCLIGIADYCLQQTIYSFSMLWIFRSPIQIVAASLLLCSVFFGSSSLFVAFLFVGRISYHLQLFTPRSTLHSGTRILPFYSLISHLSNITIMSFCLLIQVVISVLTGFAWPGVSAVHSLYPPMLLVRYQSNSLIFVIIGMIILSHKLIEHLAKPPLLATLFSLRHHLLAGLQTYLLCFLWLFVNAPGYSEAFYTTHAVVGSTVLVYLTIGLLVFSLFFAVFRNASRAIDDIFIFRLLYIGPALLLISIFLLNELPILRTHPILFRMLHDFGLVGFSLNLIHVIYVTSAMVFIDRFIRRRHLFSLSIYFLLVCDVSTASYLYAYQSSVLVGDPRNESQDRPMIDTPQERMGDPTIFTSYYPNTATPGTWTFQGTMPDVISVFQSHPALIPRLAVAFPHKCIASANERRLHTLIYTDLQLDYECILTNETRQNQSSHLLIEKWAGSHISLHSFSSVDTFLLLTDSWAPGWSAAVNGDAASIMRADQSFKVISLPKGSSYITLKYRPFGYVFLFPLALLSLFLCVVLLLISVVRPRYNPFSEGVLPRLALLHSTRAD